LDANSHYKRFFINSGASLLFDDIYFRLVAVTPDAKIKINSLRLYEASFKERNAYADWNVWAERIEEINKADIADQ
jgi:hypothetical protein